MDKLYIIKIGGEVVDDREKLLAFIRQFASVGAKKILIHGGGKMATEVAEGMGIQQQMVDGRRITDAETLKVVTMVYAGLINKDLVALLQREGTNAVGLTGADGDMVRAHKRVSAFDYGFAGDIDKVNTSFLSRLLDDQVVPVIAPITHDGSGQLLNTNADTMATMIAEAMTDLYEVELVYSFAKAGVLKNADDEASVINTLTVAGYNKMKEEKAVFAGMLPKLDNAFRAIEAGVTSVSVGKATELTNILEGRSGTKIIHG